jgi:hypothetical protein
MYTYTFAYTYTYTCTYTCVNSYIYIYVLRSIYLPCLHNTLPYFLHRCSVLSPLPTWRPALGLRVEKSEPGERGACLKIPLETVFKMVVQWVELQIQIQWNLDKHLQDSNWKHFTSFSEPNIETRRELSIPHFQMNPILRCEANSKTVPTWTPKAIETMCWVALYSDPQLKHVAETIRMVMFIVRT